MKKMEKVQKSFYLDRELNAKLGSIVSLLQHRNYSAVHEYEIIENLLEKFFKTNKIKKLTFFEDVFGKEQNK